MLYIIIICLIIIGVLGYKLFQKQQLDTRERDKLKNEVHDLRNLRQYAEEDLKLAKEKTDYEKNKLEEWKRELQSVQIAYSDLVDTRMSQLNEDLEELKQTRQNELENLFNSEKKRLETEFTEYNRQIEERKSLIKDAATEAQQKALEWTKVYQDEANKAQELYESLLEPIRQYQKSKQEKLFYTIQLPEEYQADIEFLLTTVAAKVQHPDIISKLVWAEYVKPNLDNTFKRIEIKAEPGIYKLTSLENGMCYVGKSTDVKKRIADHFKSSIGIKSIADQAVHHAILKEGFWNWTIEVVTYAEKERLNELEKYYIEFFKAQEFGYNKTGGG